MRFIPHSPADIEQMLAAVGVARVDDLFRDIPDGAARHAARSTCRPACSEQEVRARLEALAARNDGASVLAFSAPAPIRTSSRRWSTTSCSAPSSTPPTRRTSPR